MESIKSPYQRLLDCLLEQDDLFQRLLDVLMSERNYLIMADIQSLVENNKLKEALLGKARALEKIRQVRVDELLKSLGRDVADLSISNLIPILEKEAAKGLINIQAGLMKTLERVKRENLANEKLAQNAKNSIESGLKRLSGDSPDSQVYKKKGKLESSRSPGRLVSKEI